jgi:hypothetical protein
MEVLHCECVTSAVRGVDWSDLMPVPLVGSEVGLFNMCGRSGVGECVPISASI